jgi:hypothetical protein
VPRITIAHSSFAWWVWYGQSFFPGCHLVEAAAELLGAIRSPTHESLKEKSSWSVVSFHSSPKRLKIFTARAYAISRSLPISRRKAVGTPDYDGSMGLALVVGPAKAGKVARCSRDTSSRSTAIRC